MSTSQSELDLFAREFKTEAQLRKVIADGVSTLGGLKRESATTGPYHEAREFDIALLAGGSGPKLQHAAFQRNKYFHLAMRRGRKIAKVAMARRLAIALYWMWRKGWDYEQLRKIGSHAGQPGNRDGVK